MLWSPVLTVRIANDTSLSILLLSEFNFGPPAFYRSITLSATRACSSSTLVDSDEFPMNAWRTSENAYLLGGWVNSVGCRTNETREADLLMKCATHGRRNAESNPEEATSARPLS
jgi:hypothetical protein